jgi:rare lipoprotein A (peptidoglycan hydrolase)
MPSVYRERVKVSNLLAFYPLLNGILVIFFPAKFRVSPSFSKMREILAHPNVILGLIAFVAGGMLSGCQEMMNQNAARTNHIPAYPITGTGSQSYQRPRVVTASWYGPGFQGRRTASGEIFKTDRMTAASRTLPLGSIVRVTNLSNGRSVIVKINDRGPYVRGRGLDLSSAAARRIGLIHRGVGRVRVVVLRQRRSYRHTRKHWATTTVASSSTNL